MSSSSFKDDWLSVYTYIGKVSKVYPTLQGGVQIYENTDYKLRR